MRAEGDLLLGTLAAASRHVLLCAPFIKAPVLSRLLGAIDAEVPVDVVTRWHAKEVAAGVSDLEVLDLVAARPGTSLRLLDRLHAKLYRADDVVLAGSANLTATALGWCNAPNLELLMAVDAENDAVRRCLADLGEARAATQEERDRIRTEANGITTVESPEAEEMDADLARPWLPRSGAPARLFQVYLGRNLDRLMSSAIASANYDLDALAIAPGLDEANFNRAVADRFRSMPAMSALMARVQDHLDDAQAVSLLEDGGSGGLPADAQWLVIKEWFVHFMTDSIEVVPQSFVVRPRPGAAR